MASFDINNVRTRIDPARGLEPSPRLVPHCGEISCADCPVRSHAVCGGLELDVVHELAAILTFKEYGEGDPVFDEGEGADHYYVVTSGTVRLYKLMPDGRRQIIGFLYPGDVLGLHDDHMYSYSADALGETCLCRFPAGRLVALMRRFPGLEHRMLEATSHELVEAQANMLLLGRKTAMERVTSFLSRLADQAEARGEPPENLLLPMSRADIGDYLGLTTETVSRALSRLKAKGAIDLENKHVRLRDREVIRDMTGDS